MKTKEQSREQFEELNKHEMVNLSGGINNMFDGRNFHYVDPKGSVLQESLNKNK